MGRWVQAQITAGWGAREAQALLGPPPCTSHTHPSEAGTTIDQQETGLTVLAGTLPKVSGRAGNRAGPPASSPGREKPYPMTNFQVLIAANSRLEI